MKNFTLLILLSLTVACAKRDRLVEARLQPNANSEAQITKIIATEEILRQERMNGY